MKIIDVPTPGGPEALVVAQRPLPTVNADDVLIEVAAAGINRADALQRRGGYPPPKGAPSWPGLEVAGTVAGIGRNVTEFAIGDKVCALVQGGGYAQYCAVDAGQTLRVPAGFDMVNAASLPEAYFTVWSNVFEFGRLQPGERVLVHGGSSGIGVTAIQLAHALGSTVFTTAGDDDKCRFCEQLGATRAIDYKREDFVAAIAAATDNQGVNVVLDMVGGSYVARNLQVLATEGRLVMIAVQGGREGEIDVLRIMQQRLQITGSMLRPRAVEFKRQIKAKLYERVWPLLENGTLRPVVDKVFPLELASQAHALMESSAHKGKIILSVG
jgi:putative PIG3 family NAD(P)H quinone oxidoreductase